MIADLAKLDSPILRKKATRVVKFDKSLSKLIERLANTLVLTGGLGIAAPQISSPQQIFLTNISKINVYINPKITKYSKEVVEMEEGCLSIPGYRGMVTRPNKVTLQYQDKKSRTKVISASKLLARVFQHEVDHLNGVLYIDRMPDKSKLLKVVPIRIVFFGTPETVLTILEKLISLKHSFDYEVVGVVTGTQTSPVANLAKSFDLSVISVEKVGNLKDESFVERIKSLRPDVILVTSFGRILPQEVLSIPRFGCLNVHYSLLPKYRGGSPVQSALLNGEKTTGITIFLMNEKLDKGDVLAQKEVSISRADTFETLNSRLSEITSKFLIGVMHSWVKGRLKPQPQDHSKATYNKLLTKDHGLIDLNSPPQPEILERMIRAYHPWPGVWTMLRIKNQESRIKILPAKMVQIEGKTPIPLEEFKRGYPGFKLDY